VTAGAARASSSGRIEWANALRGVAALSVLAVHYLVAFYTNNAAAAGLARRPPLWATDEGAPRWSTWLAAVPVDLAAFGVGLFFLISGFVIAISLDRYSRRGFVVGRSMRILPTYAAGYLVTCTVIWAMSDPAHELTPGRVLAGMVPGLANVLGVAAPADGIVWTLVVEIVFYAFCLVAYRTLTRRWWAVAAAAAVCVALQVGLPRLPWELGRPFAGIVYILVLASPFVPVMLVGVAVSALRSGQMSLRAVVILVPALAATHTLLLTTSPVVTVSVQYRVTFVLTIAAFCAVAALAGGWRPHPVADFFADISYPLYVVHGVLGYALLYSFAVAGLRSPVAVPVTVAVAVTVAWVLHRLVEVPSHRRGRLWARHLSAVRTVAPPAASPADEPAFAGGAE
jgi:peptidoglycan/LPS O-acetylase OafA/YrhL